MSDIRVIFTKYDGSLHWHMAMQRLGEDEHGLWAGMRAGTSMTNGAGKHVTLPIAHVSLFPRTGWWTAWFNANPHEVSIYCDITTPPEWPAEDVVTMVDLDLDVVRRIDGSVLLVDEDEFAEHCRRFGYPLDVVKHAVEAAQWLHTAVGSDIEPFGQAHERWLRLVQD